VKNVVLLAFLAALMACSGKGAMDGPPSKERALRDINTRYLVFGRSLDFDIGRTGTDCYFPRNGPPFDIGYRPETDLPTIVAVKAGLVSIKTAGKDRWDVTLTDKGNALVNAEGVKPIHHRVGNGCDEYQITFTIARAHVSEVSGPKAEADTYQYTYLWKWEVTPLGAALRQNGDVYSTLTPLQRDQLQELIKVLDGLTEGPVLPVPVPSDADNSPRPGIAVFKKEGDRWVLNVRQ
jgi:hypothetical protein